GAGGGGPLDVRRRLRSRVRRSAAERRVSAAPRARFGRTLRPRGRCRPHRRVGGVGPAARRRARAARSVARAVALCDDHRLAERRVDTTSPLGTTVNQTGIRAEGRGMRWAAALCLAAAFWFVPAARAFAGERYAVIITGAAGGDAYEQKYVKWRTAFV